MPAWSALRADGGFLRARTYRDDDKIRNRKVSLQPRKCLRSTGRTPVPASPGRSRIMSRGCPAIVAAWSPRRPTAPMALDITTSQSVHLATIRRKAFNQRVPGSSPGALFRNPQLKLASRKAVFAAISRACGLRFPVSARRHRLQAPFGAPVSGGENPAPNSKRAIHKAIEVAARRSRLISLYASQTPKRA